MNDWEFRQLCVGLVRFGMDCRSGVAAFYISHLAPLVRLFEE